MHVPFSFVRCPSCGSTFETGTCVTPPANGGGKVRSQTDQVTQPAALFAPASVLYGWKDISTYLGRGVRTVQRWEHDLGFPVHRPNQHERSAVIAFPGEINGWLHGTPIGLPPKPVLRSGEGRAPVRAGARQAHCA